MSAHIEIDDFPLLESSVRNGEQPDCPCVLDRYLTLSNARAANQASTAVQHNIHMRTYMTLLDTLCDTYVPEHWRALCLDQIHKPLFAIERLACTQTDKARVRQLYNELSILSHYFL